ncbi:TPA: helix-turn-helix domain-containing protein [Raoultella planticola]|uniref:helix-turn-helix domain-containing protein n=1 Tax=Klebsiella/Raoultella group TaxID=2890311 RepID=UPI00062C0818|nr:MULTISPECIES: helix-turn-helix domain-containing protein [Klebsiella]ELU0689013.1 helix-turn-helix domain-containing protein [Raoultella planticola]DAY86918.1 MAG TPA: Putative antitoxin of bacterial toxin-antitoxin system, YdaS/YdaT [Caudoviricetes sp.]KKY66007.1 transcriptional regulator [Klebsiella michiganensis]MBM1117039.1 helix-turn-helix domain-containing protein [Klebsiella grimontii]MBR7534621.1 helix-turn-helix domain-containing protein [Klebsiella michiganensis]
MTNKTIQKAIDIAGSQKKLADLCGVAQPTVWRWLHGGGIEARYVMKIVSATNGKVKAAEIRPDLAQLLGAQGSAA